MAINWFKVFKIDPKVEKFVREDTARRERTKKAKLAKKAEKK